MGPLNQRARCGPHRPRRAPTSGRLNPAGRASPAARSDIESDGPRGCETTGQGGAEAPSRAARPRTGQRARATTEADASTRLDALPPGLEMFGPEVCRTFAERRSKVVLGDHSAMGCNALRPIRTGRPMTTPRDPILSEVRHKRAAIWDVSGVHRGPSTRRAVDTPALSLDRATQRPFSHEFAADFRVPEGVAPARLASLPRRR